MTPPSYSFNSRSSNFMESFIIPTSSDPSLGAELTATKPRHVSWNGLGYDPDTESESEETDTSDDCEEDEEEVIFALDESAMAELPLRLQNIMREIQAERFIRLTRENPNIKIRTDSFYCGHPREGNSASMPPWLAASPDFEHATNFRHFQQEYPALPDPALSRSLNANVRTKQPWIATPACHANAFGRPRAVSATAHSYLNRGPQAMPQPQKDRSASRRRQSLKRPNLEDKKNGGYSRFSSLSLKPVATNVRARVKKSFQRLNRLIRR